LQQESFATDRRFLTDWAVNQPLAVARIENMSDFSFEPGKRGSTDLAVEESPPKLKRPPLYRVILLNDDYTPMEFVVQILERVFSMDRNTATRVMLEVHTKGKGICGVYTYEIAETKVAQVTTLAQQHQHPLLCTMEET
jgi:ATP-dependent Clp protease adaptor protein ClpS